MSRTIKAHKEAAIHEAITRRESQMTYDNEAIVRNATRPRETFWTSPDGSAASPRMACLTTSAAKRHIEASI